MNKYIQVQFLLRRCDGDFHNNTLGLRRCGGGGGGVPGAGEQFRDKNASLAPPRNERFSVPEIRKKL